MSSATCSAPTVRARPACFGGKAVSAKQPARRVMPLAAHQTGDAAPAADARRGAAAALAAALLLAAGPSTAAGLDTNTFKDPVKAKIEYSDITEEKGSSVVDKLKNEVLPDAKAKLSGDAEEQGSSYKSSIAKELDTVKTEVDALDKSAKNGLDDSVVKSSASGIEQQVNALKGILGFN